MIKTKKNVLVITDYERICEPRRSLQLHDKKISFFHNWSDSGKLRVLWI